MKNLRPLLTIVLWSSLSVMLSAGEPVFDAIKYSTPKKYLEIPDSLGDQGAIANLADKLKSANDRKTLMNILRWMQLHLKYDGDQAYEWRDFDTVVSERCYGGCADQAIVCGALLKSAGISAVWVKTMDVEWIWDFKKKRQFDAWSGHVFLEIYLDEKWVLLDPGAARIYTNYSTKSRILPGNRFAYHKGNDPKKMIMSLQWEEWKQQSTSFFNDLDEGLLPVDTKSVGDIRQRCSIIANSPYYQFFGKLAQQNGCALSASFNADYDKYLPAAKGNLIIVETHNGTPIVDVAILQRYFPNVPDGKQAEKVVDGDTTIVFFEIAGIAGRLAEATNEQNNEP